MPLPLKDRKIASIEYIIKRMKGGDDYDSMKSHNSGEGREQLSMREKPESDYKTGMKMAVDEMLGAVERKDSESFEKGLRSFISMMIDSNEDDKELLKKDEIEHLKRGEG